MELGKITAIKRVLHVFYTRKQVYVNNFVKFLCRNDKLNDHYSHSFFFFDKSPVKGTIELVGSMHAADLVVFHGFFLPTHFFKAFSLMPWLQRKSYWVTWGGDVYQRPPIDRARRFDRKVNDLLKRIYLPNISGIGSNAGDYNMLRSNYGKSIAKGSFLFYPNPVDFELLDKDFKKDDVKVVLIGNSGSETNNHFKAMEILRLLYLRENFKVICPLSSGDRNYAREVFLRGDFVFEDFIPLWKFLSKEDYAIVIKSADVALMCHERQEGTGTILALAYSGAKIYMKKNVSTYGMLKLIGVNVYDIENIDMREFWKISDDEKKSNKEIIKHFFSEKKCVQYWKNIFDS